MIIAELSRIGPSTEIVNLSPFVYSMHPGSFTLASYWTTTFSAPDDSVTADTLITSVVENPATKYIKANSIVAVEATQQSFYWDNANQILYVHITHTTLPDPMLFSIGVASGYTNKDVMYLDDVEYLPLLRAVPSVAQKADLINYSRLAFISGSVEFDNTGGDFDQFIDQPIYGNDLSLFYMPDTGTTRADLVPLAALYVEDYNFSLSRFSVRAQDKRKAQNSKILREKTARGVDVPLIYGQVKRATALIDEAEGTTGNVTYRVAEALTALGTVQVDIDGTWTTRSTASVILSTGTFTLTAANGRVGGSASGAPLPCRVVDCVGYTDDPIPHLNQRVLGIPFLDSFYDLTEWASESAQLVSPSVVFAQNIELYEAIRILQNGNVKGFRYEIRADGLRTIRIDDWDREPQAWYQLADSSGDIITTQDGSPIWISADRGEVDDVEIKDSNSLQVSTDSAIFAASVTVAYAKDWNQGSYSRVTNTDYEQSALDKYRQNPNLEIESLLYAQADAEARAEWSASRLSEIRGILTCELHGQDFYDLRIYDTLNIAIGRENRTYFGRWKAQVIGIDPRFDGLSNRVTMVLVGRLA